MVCFLDLFMVYSVLALANSMPFKFGGGLGYKSHTEIGGDAAAEVGAEKDLGGAAKGRGFLDWLGGLSGTAYAGDYGVKGTLGSTAGGGVKADGRVGVNGGSENTTTAQGGFKGNIDKEVHGNVFGDVRALDDNEMKSLHNRNNFLSNEGFNDENEEGYGARDSRYGGW